MKRVMAVALLIGGVAVFGSPAEASASVKVIAKCNPDRVTKRPSAMIFACGDAGLQASGLRWKSWGGRRAKATGTIIYKLCDPYCAVGGLAYRSGKVTLYAKARCGKRRWVYQRARVKVWDGPTTTMRIGRC